ncbi:carboxymuconolactone decarboxylase family protein [Lactococcus piscium]|uniref:carboxymuconolactone decarboxylase family protein n=1 Tax=Pseudolactococcus carnosus TaxID=2749961 RepID=UPI0008128F3E|nr:carboxymuconolactone decarboxylase family protein [Lactococcus carnosus]MBQ2652874.1 carboxymuconolactone decarboxylase family protein [Methanobrevibacter sp.]MCJ1975041.1 carboxymuconolactone decarboxylase family protein [Lactococcus carnosus]MCJ1985491.1 carboxymuconolactone decarboxylase family protein [Lactococcus carnosus]SCA90910.1 putative gamma-carboxymuconolactone decarboxylase [Lactococcus piscium]
MNKYENGLRIREAVTGKVASQLVSESLADIAPILDQKTLLAFHEAETRGILDMKQREMITITSLLTQGDTSSQLKIHIQGALNVGLRREEIVETFIHCLPYVGFPRVLNAISVAKTVFGDK